MAGSALAAGAWGVPLLASCRALTAGDQSGANERIHIGVIGIGRRASQLIEQLPEGAELVALCDCNLSQAEQYKAKRQGDWPVYQDYRKLLEQKNIDAVIIGTREFQRVLPCIHACQAGKDIYAEKPLSLYVHEGRVLVDAVRKHQRILQVGSQQRSMEMNRVACEHIRGGGLGKIREVRAVNYYGPRPPLEPPLLEEPVPDGLDWDAWLNQAAWRPYNSKYLERGGAWDVAGGQMTNWGAHGVDQVQWALGMDDTGPVEMWPITPGLDGQVGMRYANGVRLNFVLDQRPMGGAIFIGETGKIEVNRSKFTSSPKEIAVELLRKVNEAEEEKKWSDETALWQARWHLQNWLDCIRTRKLPAADVEIGHRSISVCHLANVTRFVGRRLNWDPAKERFDDEEANRWVIRQRRRGWELPEVV